MRHRGISFNLALGRAFQGMVRVLFQPFDMERWFVFGLAAWLGGTSLNASGGSFQGNFGNLDGFPGTAGPDPWERLMHALPWILIVGGIALAVVLAILLVFEYLKSRFSMVFVDQMAFNQAEIRRPWREYREEGRSQFRWRAAALVITVLLSLGLLAGVLLGLKPVLQGEGWSAATIGILGALGVLLVGLQIAASAFTFTMDGLITPLMFRYRCSAAAAWAMVAGLWSWSPGFLIRYVLCEFVISLFAAGLTAVAIVLTCCIASCILSIPYLGSVAFLPVLVFHRLFSMEVLRQLGESYDPFPAVPEPPPAESSADLAGGAADGLPPLPA